jgi:hypothetical protein
LGESDLKTYVSLIDKWTILIFFVTAVLSAVIGAERKRGGYWEVRAKQMPFIFIAAWGLLIVEIVGYMWAYVSNKFPRANEALFGIIPCLCFAIGYGALLFFPKDWFNTFASPLVPLFISASSIRKFVSSLKQPLSKMLDVSDSTTPREAIINFLKTILKLGAFQVPAILYLAFFKSSPFAEVWILIFGIISMVLGSSISFLSIGISIFR